MTKPVPIEAAHTLDKWLGPKNAGPKNGPLFSTRLAMRELVEFALQFEPQSLPGEMSNVLAGEQREIILALPSCDADELGLIRVNGRVFVPEVVEPTVLHVAGNGQELTVDVAEGVAASLDALSIWLRDEMRSNSATVAD